MRPEFRVDADAFGKSIRRLAALNNKTQAATLLSFAKTTLRNRDGSGLIDLTPPARKGAIGPNAKKLGESAIDRDLNNVFAAVKLKGKKEERYPDVAGIHGRLLRLKRPGDVMAPGSTNSQKYFVDEKKVRALRRKLYSHVGKLASGWLPAARRLGASVPAWIGRHGTGAGAVRVDLKAPKFEIEMTLFSPRNAPAAELERRVRYALLYTQDRLGRAIQGAINPDARKAGFFTSK